MNMNVWRINLENFKGILMNDSENTDKIEWMTHKIIETANQAVFVNGFRAHIDLSRWTKLIEMTTAKNDRENLIENLRI